jgi:CRISPR-associated endonuclease/helicase Cas3
MMSMDPSRLWAKSKRDDEREVPSMFLPGHLQDVFAAARQILDATADEQLIALGLDANDYRERFRRCVLLAAAVHDLGKANDHFQGMIRRAKERQDKQQGIRHEWVTVLTLRSLREWLLPAVDGSVGDFGIVEWAVAGHHPAHDHASPPKLCPLGAGVEFEMLYERADFTACLRWLGEQLIHSGPPTLRDLKRSLVGADNVFTEFVAWSKAARRTWDALDEGDRRFVAAVKDCLVSFSAPLARNKR